MRSPKETSAYRKTSGFFAFPLNPRSNAEIGDLDHLFAFLVDEDAAQELEKLYFRRWNVELHFRQIKTMLGMDVLHCLTPRMVLKELAMHRIAYNLIRALMQRAALTYDVDLERISFKGSLDSLHHFADAIYAAHRKPRKQAQLFDALLRVIASDLVPLRPERSEPRARKRRPKNYQLLTKPRKKMHTAPHRNRPKNKS